MTDQHHEKLGVAVLTTSGRWPAAGFDAVSAEEKVRNVLDQAAKHLHLANTREWIATVGAKNLNSDHSFAANGIAKGDVVIDFGPRQGGGGRA